MTVSSVFKASLLLLSLFCAASCARETAGTWSMMTGDYAAAETKLQALLEKNPDDLVVRRRLGAAYFHDQKYADAASQFGYALQRDSIRPEEQIEYGLALIGSGKTQDGINVLESFSYPEHYRIQETVRQEVGKLDTSRDPQLLAVQLEKAWDRGRLIEQEERRHSHRDGTHRYP